MALTETDATRTGTGRSTGPRTAEGKARSSMNAVKHGLTARTALLEGEDAQAFREFVWEVVEDLAPVGPVERQLATRVALFMWKRGRLEEAERQVMGELSRRYGGETGGTSGVARTTRRRPRLRAACRRARRTR